MKNISLILLLMLCMFKADAQDYTNPKVLGDKAFRDKNYYEAAFYYKKAADGLNLLKQTETPYSGSNKSKKIAPVDRAYICYMLAESYRLYENYLEAEGWYYNVLNENFEAKYPLARLWYGVCLRANQHFDESISQLQDFIAAYKGDSNNIAIARKEIQTCNFAKEQYQYPLFLDIVKLRGAWNSDGSDYSIIKRDQNYWYTSSRIIKGDKKHLNRIYAALASDNFKPQIINFKQDTKAVDLEYGTPSLDPAGKRMYLTRWYKEGAKSVRGIYKSEWQNGEWAMPVKLNANVNAEGFNSIQPFITADGKHLYFSSNKPGGQGGDDIWMSDLDNEGNPISSVNLGKAINSPFDEEAPYYDEGEKKLIYSSKGFLGLGGFDFYESFEKAGRWQQSQNMGYPMNSAKDDLYYYPDNNDPNKFYISSDRESECCLELFEVHDRRHILTGLVVDCNTHKALAGVKVSLVDSITKQTLRTEVLDQRGKYNFAITTKRPHNLVFEKPEYFTKVIQAPTSGKISNDTLYNAEVCLQAFVVNKPIVLENILYDFNKATLRPESKEVLNKLVTILKDNPAIKIELASHTDSIGSDAYNNNLSQQRAQACVDYIIASGITDTRIFARGYGKTKPVAPNSTPDGKDNPDGRQLNRRTEFTVLKTE